MKSPVLAVCTGDPAGVGPEVALKALARHPDLREICTPVLIGSRQVLQSTLANLKIDAVLQPIADFSGISWPAKKILCFDTCVPLELPEYGQLSAKCGLAAFSSVEKSVSLALEGSVSGIVTAPINKEALRLACLPYIDHTQMLQKLTGRAAPLTLFVTESLRVFFYGKHIPFRDVAASLDVDRIVICLKSCQRALAALGYPRQRLALAALNPHGSDHGMFGDEEEKLLMPAVKRAMKEGVDVRGPVPADSVFHLAKEGAYDAVLALYHDQGHIAAKTLNFHKTVSLSLGLPFLRTSVDHGTAMDIAGQGVADETSMVEAIKVCARHAADYASYMRKL